MKTPLERALEIAVDGETKARARVVMIDQYMAWRGLPDRIRVEQWLACHTLAVWKLLRAGVSESEQRPLGCIAPEPVRVVSTRDKTGRFVLRRVVGYSRVGGLVWTPVVEACGEVCDDALVWTPWPSFTWFHTLDEAEGAAALEQARLCGATASTQRSTANVDNVSNVTLPLCEPHAAQFGDLLLGLQKEERQATKGK